MLERGVGSGREVVVQGERGKREGYRDEGRKQRPSLPPGLLGVGSLSLSLSLILCI